MSTEVTTPTRPPVSLSARDLRDTKGAATVLAERMGKDGRISVDTIHLLVRHGKLQAYVFDENGMLALRKLHHTKRSGQALYFSMTDLYSVELPRDTPGRPPARTKN